MGPNIFISYSLATQSTGLVKGKLAVPGNSIDPRKISRLKPSFAMVMCHSRNYRGLSGNFRDKIRDFRILKTKDFLRDSLSQVLMSQS